jgi:hypothetical protein
MPPIALFVAFAGCGHGGEVRVVATVEPPDTIQGSFTADTARLQSSTAPSAEAGAQALAAIVQTQLATVESCAPISSRATRACSAPSCRRRAGPCGRASRRGRSCSAR